MVVMEPPSEREKLIAVWARALDASVPEFDITDFNPLRMMENIHEA